MATSDTLQGAVSDWMTRSEAAHWLRVSTDTIDRNRVLWTDARPAVGKFRYRMVRVGREWQPRIWAEDVKENCFQ
jgi:hypothetical protein